ncbi:hypothetical protein SAMN05216299_11759 [Nitrosospira sp. Nsp14]|nr:hypothetical protein SAMN05216299_11759 [Nitrosospira sp. Nsp14]
MFFQTKASVSYPSVLKAMMKREEIRLAQARLKTGNFQLILPGRQTLSLRYFALSQLTIHGVPN